MVKVKIKNHYHNTTDIENGSSLDEIKQNYIGGLEVTADSLTESELISDWQEYYKTYDQAYNDTYNQILEQLISEVSFTVVQ